MHIRPIQVEDAEAFLSLCRQLDEETRFMMYEPGERTTTVEQQRDRIASLLQHDNQMIFIAEHDGRLVGYLGAFGGDTRRIHHSVYIVIGILQEFVGQGIGARLFANMETWARRQGLHRLELTVMAHNPRGIALYKKMGFQVEGVKKHSLLVDGEYVDELAMAKLL